jgi:hypothetical protein
VGRAEPVGHLPGSDLQGREQVDDPVPPIVVRVADRTPGAQRQGCVRSRA